MKKKLLPVLLLLPPLLSAQPVVPAMPDGAEAFFGKLMAGINARHVAWVKTTATEVNTKNLSEQDVRKKATQYGLLGKMDNQDIEALAFLVMMQSAKSAQEDLKAIMAKVKSINSQKATQREMLSRMQQQRAVTAVQLDSFKLLRKKTVALQKNQNPDTVKLTRSVATLKPVNKAEMDKMIDEMKKDLDAMSEMGEMESLRLQMAMDRMSKLTSTLSNILKKISKTSDAIVQNLK